MNCSNLEKVIFHCLHHCRLDPTLFEEEVRFTCWAGDGVNRVVHYKDGDISVLLGVFEWLLFIFSFNFLHFLAKDFSSSYTRFGKCLLENLGHQRRAPQLYYKTFA